MAHVRVEDVSHVRFRAPDLDVMRSFLEDFGLTTVEQATARLVMRGAGSAPAIHITEPGEPGFIAAGFRTADLDDLERLSRAENVAITPSDMPGGGWMITLIDPDGHRIEVVAGQTLAAPLAVPVEQAWNQGPRRDRLRTPKRVAPGPAHVLRLGHVVLSVSDFRASEAWYKARLGLITSDEIRLAPDFALGAFLRCDRGDTPTDHHSLFLIQSPKGPGFGHAAFEVAGLDDLMLGRQTLLEAGRHAEWGVGRHILGSQIFDYWRDPWGHTLEHWTDGDLFTAQDPPGAASLPDLLGVQWGPPAPPTMA